MSSTTAAEIQSEMAVHRRIAALGDSKEDKHMKFVLEGLIEGIQACERQALPRTSLKKSQLYNIAAKKLAKAYVADEDFSITFDLTRYDEKLHKNMENAIDEWCDEWNNKNSSHDADYCADKESIEITFSQNGYEYPEVGDYDDEDL